jgi:WhiB family redox-sensing transcriptional regulator
LDHNTEGDGGMFASEQFDPLIIDIDIIELIDITDAPVDEWAEARCRIGDEGLTELFFSDQIPDIALAKALCAECPVQAACLDGAIERREPWGVWGGQLFAGGKILAQKRKRGRPPKNRTVEPVQMTA